MEWLTRWFDSAQQWLFESVVQPLMFAGGLASFLEEGYSATGWLLVGVLQLFFIVALIAPLQRWWPAEPLTDRAAVRTDIVYTLVHRLGLFRLGLFFAVDPLWDSLFGALRMGGLHTFQLDGLWPGVTDGPWVSLLLYLVVFDVLDYWIHRGQHRFEWWWRLHALHHSQRQMTVWSDNRNHLLDSILWDSAMVVAAQLIGVPPEQFIVIVALTQLSESFQHANIRLWFGHIGERLWVSPRFHRLHHSIGIGHETAANNTPEQSGAACDPLKTTPAVKLGGHNFGVLLPVWDVMFGTANFEQRYDPTGIRDQVEAQRDYGRGFWSQQWMGLKRLFGRA